VSAARAILALGVCVLACTGDTSRLTPEQETRFAAEGIVHRADNIWFRYTHDAGTRSAGWEDRLGRQPRAHRRRVGKVAGGVVVSATR
jgi:hypothetical protein